MCFFVVTAAAGAFYAYKQAYLLGRSRPLTELVEAPPPAQEPEKYQKVSFRAPAQDSGGLPWVQSEPGQAQEGKSISLVSS